MNQPTEHLQQDLDILTKTGLIEVTTNENGETVYKTKDNIQNLTDEQLLDIIIKTLEQETEK